MIGDGLGDCALADDTHTGSVVFHAKQSGPFGIEARWSYEGYEPALNIFYAVYLDGELVRRLAGSATGVHLLTDASTAHDLKIEPWSREIAIPDEAYGAVSTQRAHIEWTRDTDTSIEAYKVYHSTDDSEYTLYATHDDISLQTGWFALGTGATLQVLGQYGQNDHTNTLFTFTVVSAALGTAAITNDKNATSIPVNFRIGNPVTLFAGVQAVVTGTPANADAANFRIGVQPEYNTGVLASGTHYFKIASVDGAGNTSALSAAIPITISAPPAPVASFALGYTEATNLITCSGIQSPTDGVASIKVYSNYDSAMGALLDAVDFDMPPLITITAAHDAVFTNTTLLAASGKPAGTYQFVPRAVNASGIDDGSSVVYEMDLPYIPTTLPTAYNLTATPQAAGAVLLEWSASNNVANAWQVATAHNTAEVSATESLSDDGVYAYSATLAYATWFNSSETEETITLTPLTATDFAGTSATVKVTPDATAPSAPTGLTGVPF